MGRRIDLVHGWLGRACAGWCWCSASSWVWVRGFVLAPGMCVQTIGPLVRNLHVDVVGRGCSQAPVPPLSVHKKLAETALLLWRHVSVLLCRCPHIAAAVRFDGLATCASSLLAHLCCIIVVLLGSLRQCWHQQLCAELLLDCWCVMSAPHD